MAVAIDTSRLALGSIPTMQRKLDRGGGKRRFQIHRVSANATILPYDSEVRQQLHVVGTANRNFMLAKQEPLNWQADPDDDLGDAAVLHHLQQQAATIPLLSSGTSQSHHGNAATTLTGTALSASIKDRTQGRPLSSFDRFSYRFSKLELGVPTFGTIDFGVTSAWPALFLDSVKIDKMLHSLYEISSSSGLIVWAGPRSSEQLVFSQVQVDVVDLASRRLTTSCRQKRRRTAFNQFRQVSHSPGVQDTNPENPPPQLKQFNGVRHRSDRNIWVAEMKPTKHKTKQDFGNFKTQVEAARAVDAAFHHYGRPDLLNFPHTSLRFLSTRPAAPAGLDQEGKVKFVREEAKLLLAAAAACSPLHSTHSSSLQDQELSASPRRCPSGPFRSFSEISSPFRCSGPAELDDVVSQPQPGMLHDSICDISTTGVLSDLETLNSVQNTEQVWDWVDDSCTVAAPLHPSASESPSLWVESVFRLSPAPTYPRSPGRSPFEEEIIAYALLEDQST